MKVLELQNDNFELIGMRDDLLEYLKDDVIHYVKSGDTEAMRSIDLNEYADLFDELNEKDEDILLKVSFIECVMNGTASPCLYELVEKEV